MGSDKDFFSRLFEGPPDMNPDEPKKKNFNIEHFAEWLDDHGEGDETLTEFVDRRRQERSKDEFRERLKKKRKKRKDG